MLAICISETLKNLVPFSAALWRDLHWKNHEAGHFYAWVDCSEEYSWCNRGSIESLPPGKSHCLTCNSGIRALNSHVCDVQAESFTQPPIMAPHHEGSKWGLLQLHVYKTPALCSKNNLIWVVSDKVLHLQHWNSLLLRLFCQKGINY